MEPSEIWARVTDRVQQEIADPTVWLAMRAVKPLLIDGSFFVASLPDQEEYLAIHLLNNQATIAIEDALREVAGRILAFRLILGDSLADWNAEKLREQASETEGEIPAEFRDTFDDAAPTALTRSAPRAAPIETQRDVSQTWEKLSERLNLAYKTAPFIKYPHGQAQYVLTAVKLISDTMDVQMPPAGAPREDAQERALAKIIERLSGIVNLDSLFIALELLRYRELHGKNTDIAL
jgi:hypothetical protein